MPSTWTPNSKLTLELTTEQASLVSVALSYYRDNLMATQADRAQCILLRKQLQDLQIPQICLRSESRMKHKA